MVRNIPLCLWLIITGTWNEKNSVSFKYHYKIYLEWHLNMESFLFGQLVIAHFFKDKFICSRKFYIRKFKNKINSIEKVSQLLLIYFPEVIQRIAVYHAFLIIYDKNLSLLLYLWILFKLLVNMNDVLAHEW